MAKEKKDKTPKKVKPESTTEQVEEAAAASKTEDSAATEISYETRVKACSPIAHPLANKKLTKKVLKTVKKAAKTKSVRRGVKEIVKALRKGQKGIVVIAGDVFPIDVVTHLPVLCEESDVSYIYVPSKEELGNAGATKRATSCILVVSKGKEAEYADLYEDVLGEVKGLNEKMITA
ncbi:RNA-binding protein [Phlyctochytrium arcticum]|nr:RNA-binding protein [Phlyctochytrium arcticum]